MQKPTSNTVPIFDYFFRTKLWSIALAQVISMPILFARRTDPEQFRSAVSGLPVAPWSALSSGELFLV
jgi:hypothetical protein